MDGVVLLAALAGCGRVGFEGLAVDARLDPDAGLVGHWTFEEGSGTRVADATEFANAGTLVGGVGFAPGRIGMALSFDGVDGRVDIEEVTGVLDMGTRSFSYSLWVNVTSTVGMYDAPWWRGGSSTFYPGYDMELGADPWRAHVSDGVAGALGSLGAVTLDRWVLLTVVVDREQGMLFVYRDGAVVDAAPFGLGSLSGSRTASMGGRPDGMDLFHGLLDDVRVYNRALDPREVDALYRAPDAP